MKYIHVKGARQDLPAIIQGCMRLPSLDVAAARRLVCNAVDLGVVFFDHATCSGKNGEAETRFGEAFVGSGIKREDVFIQSKCGIYPQRQVFDWSRGAILTAVDEILTRLKTDYLDSLLLHRPDLLFEPDEVAGAVEELFTAGKIRNFGVSNLSPTQCRLLSRSLNCPIVFNQLQLSLTESQLLDHALFVNNRTSEYSIDRDCGLLDYCRLNNITVQAWSPLQYGFFEGTFIDNPKYPGLNAALEEVGKKYGLSKGATAIAWILRHPAQFQVILGTMNPERLADLCQATEIEMERDDWYKLYLSTGKILP